MSGIVDMRFVGECGGIDEVATALTVWAHFRSQSGSQPTISDAMRDFNANETVVRAAIEESPWLYLVGEGVVARIGVDGE